eukprot:Rmarinus@m.26477
MSTIYSLESSDGAIEWPSHAPTTSASRDSRNKSEGEGGQELLFTLLLDGAYLVASYYIAKWTLSSVKSVFRSASDTLDSERTQELRRKIIERLSHGNPEVEAKLLDNNEYENALLMEVVNPDDIKVTLNDVGGLVEQKKILYESVIWPISHPEMFTGILHPTKGVLLYGPPGTGKTMLAKALAKESGANFLAIRMSSVLNKFVGETQRLARAIFTLAYKLEPCIIFVDEIDSMLRARSGDDHQVTADIKTEFLTLWDGLTTDEQKRVTVLAASNRPWDIDHAIQRRLTRAVLTDLPDRNQREQILRVILSKHNVEEEFRYESVADATDGFSGSDLKDLCQTAAMIPVREVMDREEHSSRTSHGTPQPRSRRDGSGTRGGHNGSEAGDGVSNNANVRPLRTGDFHSVIGSHAGGYVPTATQSEQYLSRILQQQRVRTDTLLGDPVRTIDPLGA